MPETSGRPVTPVPIYLPADLYEWLVLRKARGHGPLTQQVVRYCEEGRIRDELAEAASAVHADQPSNCYDCWHLWSKHGPDGCTAKIFPKSQWPGGPRRSSHSLTGEPCPCGHTGPEAVALGNTQARIRREDGGEQ